MTTDPQEFRGLTRDDVAHAAAAALEDLSPEDRATVEGHAPSVALGLAFRRAQSAWCDSSFTHTPAEQAEYNRTANLATAAMIFERADDPEAAALAIATHDRIRIEEHAAEAKKRDALYERVLASQWAGAETYGAYKVRTEERGHGIVAVYVRGPASAVNGIERATAAYARKQGLVEGGSAGGGEFADKGRTYISQRAFHRP